MAEIRIRRKGGRPWWPLLLILLIPLAWYLVRARGARPDEPVRDTVAAQPIAPPGSVRDPAALPPPATTNAPVATNTPPTKTTTTNAPRTGASTKQR